MFDTSTCSILQDAIKCSYRKSEMLQVYGDTAIRAQALERELSKEREYSSRLLMKYDGKAVKYHNLV